MGNDQIKFTPNVLDLKNPKDLFMVRKISNKQLNYDYDISFRPESIFEGNLASYDIRLDNQLENYYKIYRFEDIVSLRTAKLELDF